MTSRRRFFANLATGAVGAAGVDRLLAAGEGFDRWLSQDPVPFDELRADYLLADGVTYFNHASIGTVPRVVHEAHVRYLTVCESNPWLHMWGGVWEAARERTRTLAAGMLGCRAAEVALTHNTTEGFNLLAAGLPLGEGDEILFSSLNHAGASACWSNQAERRGYAVRSFGLRVADVAAMSEEQVIEAHLRPIAPQTAVLVLPHMDNTVGLRHPVEKIAAAARAKGVKYVLVDGAQTLGMVPVDVAALGVDAYACSPHKWVQSPKGLGLLYLSEKVQAELQPMWVTWGQKTWEGAVRRFEDYGTRNLPAVLALGDAIEFQNKLGAMRKEHRLHSLWRYFRAAVERTPAMQWRSPQSWELGGALCAVEIERMDSREVFDTMWKKHRFVFRAFHASGVNTLRISPNVFNTEAEIDRFFEVLRRDVLG